jgi:hypothetical protein
MIIAPLVHLYFRQITPSRASIGAYSQGVQQAREELAREALVRSDTRESIVESFRGGQYIVGVSFVIVGFIKYAETSYYHVRVIYALASINFGSLCICVYNSAAIGRSELLAINLV